MTTQHFISIPAPPLYSAVDLARALQQPLPTPQQIEVIQAPLTPALVVAGAGSGKTETMANRVLWLLANNYVEPHNILGLTFTRKAAGELTDRINTRIDQLRNANLLPANTHSHTECDFLNTPTVSTYNAFANTIFRDNALLVGREPDSALLGESSAWKLAYRTVMHYGDDRLAACGHSVDSVTNAVLDLSREITENRATLTRIQHIVDEFRYLENLPYASHARKKTPYTSVLKTIETLTHLPTLAELAVRYNDEKRRLGFVEYSDQVALAHSICTSSPQQVREYQKRFTVILLDEYQDTSVAQTSLLATLFAEQAIMAVGDPHQSIYGWRGASASNLALFATDFCSTHTPRYYELTTSWRNDTVILDAANTLLRPLRSTSPVTVSELTTRPNAQTGHIQTWFGETIDDEAAFVAQWCEQQLGANQLEVKKSTAQKNQKNDPPSLAILFRMRQHMTLFAEALSARGVPHHIMGIGGLLTAPEVVDVVSALRVIHDPRAGSSLIRLLSGARWRIGVRDLKMLSRFASWLASDNSDTPQHSSVAFDTERSIIDALDVIAHASPSDPQCSEFSAEGTERLREAGRTFAFLRSRTHLPLRELVHLIEHELRLDIEILANETRDPHNSAHLSTFHDEITRFIESSEYVTLGHFLSWLDRAEKHDDLSPQTHPPEPGTVQLLTIHAAKGLEWDYVALARCVQGELPAASREADGWLRWGKLPYDLRGDALSLPILKWRSCATQQEFDSAYETFRAELDRRYQMEERRLVYVAVTRARTNMLMSGSFWSTGKTPRTPSIYLHELANERKIPPLPETTSHNENPRAETEIIHTWPYDPLGSRRSIVEKAAEMVRAANPDAPGLWEDDINLLLAERENRSQEILALPARIPASRFKDYIADPEKMAQYLRRPMPRRPFRQTRLGTLFHSWVENRSNNSSSNELATPLWWEKSIHLDSDHDDIFDNDNDNNDNDETSGDLARLQEIFNASEWADRKPEHSELEIHFSLDSHIVICKIDAVYALPEGRYEIVDWKTGKGPTAGDDLQHKQIQLALYREAFARWKGINTSDVEVAFFFVSENRVIRPERVHSYDELAQLWRSIT